MKDAAEQIKATHAIYTESLAGSGGARDVHGHLPIELKDRVNRYIEKQMEVDPTGTNWAERVFQAGSVNALIRKEMLKSNVVSTAASPRAKPKTQGCAVVVLLMVFIVLGILAVTV